MSEATLIPVTFELGLVVRKASLNTGTISRNKLLELMEDPPYSENNDLICFGPCFGGEALETFISRLQTAGLEYYDDFFELQFTHPDWLSFKAFSTS